MHFLKVSCQRSFVLLKNVQQSSLKNLYGTGLGRHSSNIAQSANGDRSREDVKPSTKWNERSTENDESTGDPWRLRRKYITTSINRIDVRPQGVTFNVGYVDTGADWHFSVKRSAPTVFAVHGLPSNHKDMLPIVRPLHDLGCRVIAVNLPGYEYSTPVTPDDERFFLQSTTEVTEFLVNFLRNLQVPILDLLIGHSAGVVPATVLAGASEGDTVRSLLAICSLPGHAPLQGELMQKALTAVIRSLDTPLLGKIIHSLLPALNRRISRFGTNNPNYLANVYRNIINQNFGVLDSMAMGVEMKQIPFTYICSENDGLMGYKISREWASKFGLQEENFEKYDDQFELEKEAITNEGVYRKGIVLKRGGHYPQFKKHTALPILIKEAMHLLDLVAANKKAS